MRRIFLVLVLIALVAWDYSQNDAHVFATIDMYVDRMMQYFHLA